MARGRPIQWNQPVLCNFNIHDTAAGGPIVDKLDCRSTFVQIAATGTPDQFTAEASFDLNRLAVELQQFVDLGSAQPSGTGKASMRWQRSAEGAFQADANGELHDFHVVLSDRKAWSEPLLTATFNAVGQLHDAQLSQLDKASLQVVTGVAGAATADRLSAVLTPMVEVDVNSSAGGSPEGASTGGAATSDAATSGAATKTAASLGSRWPIEIQLQGDLTRWQTRLAPWIALSAWQLGGNCNLTARATYSPTGLEIEKVHSTIDRLHAWGHGWFIDEPKLQLDGSAAWDGAGRTLQLGTTTLLTSTVSAESKQATLRLPAKGVAALEGSFSWQADLGRFNNWTHDPAVRPNRTTSGRITGTGNFTESGDITTAQLSAQIDNLFVYGGATARRQARGFAGDCVRGPGPGSLSGSAGQIIRGRQIRSGGRSAATRRRRNRRLGVARKGRRQARAMHGHSASRLHRAGGLRLATAQPVAATVLRLANPTGRPPISTILTSRSAGRSDRRQPDRSIGLAQAAGNSSRRRLVKRRRIRPATWARSGRRADGRRTRRASNSLCKSP